MDKLHAKYSILEDIYDLHFSKCYENICRMYLLIYNYFPEIPMMETFFPMKLCEDINVPCENKRCNTSIDNIFRVFELWYRSKEDRNKRIDNG